MDAKLLSAPFAAEEIEWRVGSTTKDKDKGLALAYLDARAVMDRLDAVCGPDGWQCRYPHANGKTCCEIGIKIESEWIWKSDGAGDTDFEGAKGAFSDAFKRAAVRWGIGRYLYHLDSPWVKIEPAGRSYRIMKAEYRKLNDLLIGIGAPAVDPRGGVGVGEISRPEFSLITPEGEVEEIFYDAEQYMLQLSHHVTNDGMWWPNNKDMVSVIGQEAGEMGNKNLQDHARKLFKFAAQAHKAAYQELNGA